MSAVRCLAPGKAMLIGEYAVLDGGPAVVAAIDCYAVAQLLPAADAVSPFVAAAQAEAGAVLAGLGRAAPGGVPVVDTAAFSLDGRKLGLGSSAAATVAAVGAIFAAAGLDLASAESRRLVHATARRAHDSAQGVAGSGADVLASSLGGLRTLNDAASADAPLRLPSPMELRLVGTSRSASTAELIGRYRVAGSAAAPTQQRMAQAARRFLTGCRAGAVPEVLAAVGDALAAFLALGAALDCELATAEHLAIAAAAEQVGGAAKPSGAGGGDLAVALLPDPDAAEKFTALLAKERLILLPLRLSEQGVHTLRT